MKRGMLPAVLIGVVFGCGKSSPTTPTGPIPAVASFKIAGTTSFSAIGQTSQFTATAIHADGTKEDVTKGTTWQTVDQSVAQFGPPGLLTTKAAGETTVSARYLQLSDSARVLVLPAGTHILNGTVREPGFIVSGATVEILDGPSAGLSRVTDNGGAYKFYGVAGVFTLRVRKDGYLAQVQQVSVTQDQVLDFTLMPSQVPVGIPPGPYRATFTASSSCPQWPDEVKSRTYAATLVQDGARLDVTLTGQGLNGGTSPTETRFSGRIVDKTVTFQVASGWDYYYYFFNFGPGYLLERVTSTRYFSLFGSATGTIAGSSVAGTLAGSFQVIDAPSGLNKSDMHVTTCAKGDHQFAFSPSLTSSSRRTR